MLMRHLLWPLVGLAVLAGSSVISFPRLSVEQSLPCGECHLNPNGGGMRNEFGNYAVALNELCLPSSKAASLERYRKPRLSESLTFGFDSRYLVMENGRVFNMQNDLFLAAEPMKDMYYHLRIGAVGVSESYALMFFSGRRFYFKGGRFYPAYGLHQSDHKSFVRERTGIETRDEHMREKHLHTEKFPYAFFVINSVTDLPDQIESDTSYRAEADGLFYIHGVSRLIRPQLTLRCIEDDAGWGVKVLADFEIELDDFKIDRPRALFLKLAETIEVEVVLAGRRADTLAPLEVPDWPTI